MVAAVALPSQYTARTHLPDRPPQTMYSLIALVVVASAATYPNEFNTWAVEHSKAYNGDAAYVWLRHFYDYCSPTPPHY